MAFIHSPEPTGGSRLPCEGQLPSLPQAKATSRYTAPPSSSLPTPHSPLASCTSHSCLPCVGSSPHFPIFSLTSDLAHVAYAHLPVPGHRPGTLFSP